MPRSTEAEPLLEELLAAIERELPRAVELRHRLHEQPELAHAEHATAATIAAELPVASTAVAGSGLIGLIGARSDDGAAQPPLAIRAELDGLPVREQTGVPFAAKGETMHACGHDVHMAALTALARAAHHLDERLPVPLLAVFQPSEEAYPSGAQMLIAEEFAGHRPAAVLGVHIHPELPWGTVSLDPGVVNASFDAVEILVEGSSTHGAYPHLGADPVLALSEVVVALQARAARAIDPVQVATLTIPQLAAGSADNVIPGSARARGALRAHRPQDRQRLREITEEVVLAVAAAHGCRGSVQLTVGEPALENDPEIVAAALGLLDAAGLVKGSERRSAGSDDFAFFGQLAPLAMAFVGLGGAEGFAERPLHHPELLPPDAAVGAVARAQAVLYVAAASGMGRASL
jgi:amidohydrolase